MESLSNVKYAANSRQAVSNINEQTHRVERGYLFKIVDHLLRFTFDPRKQN